MRGGCEVMISPPGILGKVASPAGAWCEWPVSTPTFAIHLVEPKVAFE
jgi:hypothetical protein